MVEWLKAYPAIFEETSEGGYSVFFPIWQDVFQQDKISKRLSQWQKRH